MIYLVRKLHVAAYNLAKKTDNRTSLAEVFTLAALYFFIQLNFDLVSHNFGTRSDQFIDSTHFLLLASSTTTFLSWHSSKGILLEFRKTALLSEQLLGQSPRKTLKVKIFQKVLFALTLVLVYMSFNNLLNDFF